MQLLPKLTARDPHEPNRVSTPLELFFDLAFVVAIASAASGLHHSLSSFDFVDGLLWFMLAFFSIWWSWMNYTWYSSAYDTSDTFFKLVSFLLIFGALVFAVGVANFFDPAHNIAVPLAGYVIMRIGIVFLWLRAAYFDVGRRSVCLRYAMGIVVVQLCWVGSYFLPDGQRYYAWLVLAVCEVAVPFFAEKNYAKNGGTPWHPHHIAERYSLLVIIVLGEGMLSSTNNIASTINSETRWEEAFVMGLSAAALMFSIWWSYFKIPFGEILHQNKTSKFVSFVFGYGHFFIFMSLASLAVGLELVADIVAAQPSSTSKVLPEIALACIATSVGLYLVLMSIYRTIFIRRSKYNLLAWAFAILLPGLPLVLLRFGLPIQWSLLFFLPAPVSFILLNSYDDCSNGTAPAYELEE